MGGGGEHRHIDADLGDDVLGAYLADAGDGVELGYLVQVRRVSASILAVSWSIWVV